MCRYASFIKFEEITHSPFLPPNSLKRAYSLPSFCPLPPKGGVNYRTELNRFGLKVIRFTDNEVIYNINSVKTTIQRAIDKLSPL
jgi:hypothetical protein